MTGLSFEPSLRRWKANTLTHLPTLPLLEVKFELRCESENQALVSLLFFNLFTCIQFLVQNIVFRCTWIDSQTLERNCWCPAFLTSRVPSAMFVSTNHRWRYRSMSTASASSVLKRRQAVFKCLVQMRQSLTAKLTPVGFILRTSWGNFFCLWEVW